MGEEAEVHKVVMLEETEEEESLTKIHKSIDGEESRKKNEETEKIRLVTSDGMTMEVDASIVKEMKTLQRFIDDNDTNDPIVFPLPNVTSHILNQIMELMLKEYDQELVNTLSHHELKELLAAADYLNMNTLLHCIASTIADIIKNKSVQFVRNFFDIENDFTPEEEAEIKKTHEWAFQGVDED